MSDASATNLYLPVDLFGLVLSFLVYDTPREYSTERDSYMLSLRLTSKAWRSLVDSKCRVIVVFLRERRGVRYTRRIPDHNTLPPFVLPSFRFGGVTHPQSIIDSGLPACTDAIEKMAFFHSRNVPKWALTSRPNLQVLRLCNCDWDEKDFLQSNPNIKALQVLLCRRSAEVSMLPHLKHFVYMHTSHTPSDVHVNIHSLRNLETLGIESDAMNIDVKVVMERAPEMPVGNTIYVEPFKTIKSVDWTSLDICSDERCWAWTRAIERVYLCLVPLTRISGPLQIVKLELVMCYQLREIDIPQDAHTKHLAIVRCDNLETLKVACRLHTFSITECNKLQSLDVKML
jgi:hypothetical protein